MVSEQFKMLLRSAFVGESRLAWNSPGHLFLVRLTDETGQPLPQGAPTAGTYPGRFYTDDEAQPEARFEQKYGSVVLEFAAQPVAPSWLGSRTEPVIYAFGGRQRVRGGRFHEPPALLDVNRPAYLGRLTHGSDFSMSTEMQPAYWREAIRLPQSTLERLEGMVRQYHPALLPPS